MGELHSRMEDHSIGRLSRSQIDKTLSSGLDGKFRIMLYSIHEQRLVGAKDLVPAEICGLWMRNEYASGAGFQKDSQIQRVADAGVLARFLALVY